MACKLTHEQFISAVAALAIGRLTDQADIEAANAVKLVYGAGQSGIRGITYYNRWKPDSDTVRPFVEISAFTQESAIQIAGTTIHELGHVLAGWDAAHGPLWHAACERLGLRRIKAGGTAYCMAHFAPDIRYAIAALGQPDDGQPVGVLTNRNGRPIAVKGCQAGIGTKGGKSRGAGSGSRLRLFECECVPPIKVRASRDELPVTCNCCTGLFHRA